MNPKDIKSLLEDIRSGKTGIEEAFDKLKDLPYTDLGHTKIDHHREIRTGYPEIIYCSGKTKPQIVSIIKTMLSRNSNILATRATEEIYKAVVDLFPDATYNADARAIMIRRVKIEKPDTYIAIVTAGTSDIPVAEEAAVTAEMLGNDVKRIYDVGISGIHRLLDNLDVIKKARVIVVIAGMEGALPSVIGGMVDKPIIAVPTSVGYGANFFGLSALLGMLNSCASGVSVVNIDNGFGAGYNASMINKL